MDKRARYTAIGFVVSKFVLPLVRRQAKTAAKRKAKGAASGASAAARSHPARTSIALGAAVGALGWLVTRQRSRQGDHADID
jgi:hypothetical protein